MTSGRFDHIVYDEVAKGHQAEARRIVGDLEVFLTHRVRGGRAASRALTMLEEMYMWIGKAIRDEQVTERGAEIRE